VPLSSGINKVYFATRAEEGDSSSYSAAPMKPKGAVATTEMVAVQSVIGAFSLDTNMSNRFGKNLGVIVAGISSAKIAGGAVATLHQEPWSCEENSITYFSRIKVGDSSGRSFKSFSPKFGKDGKFMGLTETLCAEKDQKIDGYVNRVEINGNATPDAFTVVYSTRFPKADNEVHMISFDGVKASYKDISKNTD
jgi:hypothetical protein